MISLSAAVGGSLAVIPAPSPAAVESRAEDAELAIRGDEDGYTGAAIASFEGAAAGYRGGLTAGAAIAALHYENGLASAVVTGADAELLSPVLLGFVGRAMATRGEAVLFASLDGADPRLWLDQCSDWDVTGSYRPRSWRYRLTLVGPTVSESRNATADEVVHVRQHVDSRVPWRGRSPLAVAASTGALAGAWERALAEEGSLSVKLVVPMPASIESMTQDHLNALRRSFGDRAIKNLFPPTAMRKGSDTPQTDWKPHRYGPEYDRAQAMMFSATTKAVALAYGVPNALASISDAAPSGQALREGWRQFVVQVIEPIGRLVEAEVSRVLGARVSLSFNRLAATDMLGRARVAAMLIKAGRTWEEARVIAGL